MTSRPEQEIPVAIDPLGPTPVTLSNSAQDAHGEDRV
jgi:hypothetical protein